MLLVKKGSRRRCLKSTCLIVIRWIDYSIYKEYMWSGEGIFSHSSGFKRPEISRDGLNDAQCFHQSK